MPISTVLVVGATGSIGRLVVEEAVRQGYRTRALVRDPARARQLPLPEAQLVVGDVTRPDTLPAAVDGVDAVVFTLGLARRRPTRSASITAACATFCAPWAHARCASR
jgi:uncharacterized protein YbjT (DUF2867 family)